LVRGINLVMEGDFYEPINLGNPDEVTILQIAREVMDLIPGTQSRIVHLPMPPDDPRVRCPDITRARQLLGWWPVISRKQGLAKMIEFYRDQLQAQPARATSA
jgi:dTDP-glucose 4,6-dehydratase